MNYLIVDDNEFDRLAILHEASKFPFLNKIAVCKDGREAFESITKYKPDIVFSDIQMPGASGLEIMRTLYGKIPVTVFITSHPEFAIESYDLQIFDYILKPLDPERFAKCISRIQDFFRLRKRILDIENQEEKSEDDRYIVVKQGYEKHRLHYSDIIYLEAMKDYTKIKTLQGQSLLILETISRLLSHLPPGEFLRVHRSYAVNSGKIECIAPNKITVMGIDLPIGKSYKNLVSNIL